MVHYTKCLQINDLEHTFAFVLFIKIHYTTRRSYLRMRVRQVHLSLVFMYLFIVTDVGCKCCKELHGKWIAGSLIFVLIFVSCALILNKLKLGLLQWLYVLTLYLPVGFTYFGSNRICLSFFVYAINMHFSVTSNCRIYVLFTRIVWCVSVNVQGVLLNK